MEYESKIEEELKEMKIHEEFYLKKGSIDIHIIRVVGGWIYSYYQDKNLTSSVLVPWINNGVQM